MGERAADSGRALPQAIASLTCLRFLQAFEPAPEAFALLRINTTHLPHVLCIQQAVAEAAEESATLRIFPLMPGNSTLHASEKHELGGMQPRFFAGEYDFNVRVTTLAASLPYKNFEPLFVLLTVQIRAVSQLFLPFHDRTR